MLTAALAVPIGIARFLILDATSSFADTGRFTLSASAGDDRGTDFVVGQLAVFALDWVLPALVSALALGLVLARARGDRDAGVSASVALSLRRWRPLTAASVLAGLGVLAGLLLCVLPGIYLAVTWLFVLPVILDERVTGRAALGRSRDLVRGRWWPTFGRYLLGVLMASVAGGLVVGAASSAIAVALDDSSRAALALYQAAATAATLFTTPFTICLLALMYLDARARRGAPTPVADERFQGYLPPSAAA